MTIDLRTPSQKKREALHDTICNRYNEIAYQRPDASPHSIICSLAQIFRLSVPGIRKILVNNNIIQVKTNPKR